MRCVLDASALFEVLAGTPAGHAILDIILDGPAEIHAPSIIVPEVLHVIRKGLMQGRITEADASRMVEDFSSTRIELHSLGTALRRVWELRNNLTPYDAVYIVLAETSGLPLITLDARMANAPAHHANTRLMAAWMR